MIIKQIYTGCLAEAAYYIESEGEAAIIDPLRDVAPYLEMATNRDAKIKYILETHFHADFVSGHLDLSRATGAPIIYGPTAQPAFDAHIATDGEEFTLGNIRIKVLHTPGHTRESVSYLLIDEEGKENALFTGDTLFIDDVGRPDLAVTGELTKEELAGMLYDSLHEKILPLEDDVIIYPGHGAGSACGKNIGKEKWDTLGNQKKHNYALKASSKDEFIKVVTQDLEQPPHYFPFNAHLNKTGYENMEEVIEHADQALKPAHFSDKVKNQKALILDVRSADEFAKAFIPGSINIGLDGQFAPWAGALITDLMQPIALIAPAGKEKEAIIRLARVGYDNCIGYLEGGINAWIKEGHGTDTIINKSASEFNEYFPQYPNLNIVDIRRKSEYGVSHLPQAKNIPLADLADNMEEFNSNRTYFLYCAGGYRSMIAASILKSRGIEKVVNISGGYNALCTIPELHKLFETK